VSLKKELVGLIWIWN